MNFDKGGDIVYKLTFLRIDMKHSLEHGSHSVFTLTYHMVLVVKYRTKIFDHQAIITRLKQICLQSAMKHEIIIREQEINLDHIHILFSSSPKTSLVQFIHHLKGLSSYLLFREFPEIKLYLWGGHLWTSSYFLATTGQVCLDIVKKYIKSQGKK